MACQSAEGAKCNSLGQRPRSMASKQQALKARNPLIIVRITRFQRLTQIESPEPRAVALGFYISRLRRAAQNDL